MAFLGITSSPSPEVLAAKRKNLVRQGKGNCTNATRELTKAEEDALFENGQFVVHDPNHYKGLCGGFFLFILAGGLEMKAVSCAGEM